MYDLEKLTQAIVDNPDLLIEDLNLDIKNKNGIITGRCAIHGGDNEHSLRIVLDRNKFTCFTNECHRSFFPTIIGFVRGVLSSQKLGWRDHSDEKFSFPQTLQYIQSLYNIANCYNGKIDQEEKRWVSQVVSLVPQKLKKDYICNREQYLKNIKMPSEYFLRRNFNLEVLKKFDVGSCIHLSSYLGGRSLVPTFDLEGRKLLGISGRWEKEITSEHPKWLHTTDFPSSLTLYNIWNAKELIGESKSVILVEGPADVWKLWEAGIYNCVALYGGTFSPAKHHQLDRLGVMNLTLALDNDKRGGEFTKTIIDQYARFYNIKKIMFPSEVKDLGDLSVEKIKELKLK